MHVIRAKNKQTKQKEKKIPKMFVRNLRGIKLYESMLFSNPHFNKISGMGVY